MNRIKYILIGPTATGKTSIINRYISNTFNKNTEITIGIEFYFCNIKKNNIDTKIHIWDTSGNPKYNNMNAIITTIDKIVIVFDYKQRYERELINEYIELALNYKIEKDIIIVYNKTPKEAIELHMKMDIANITVIYCNAEYDINIDKIFETSGALIPINTKKNKKCVIS